MKKKEDIAINKEVTKRTEVNIRPGSLTIFADSMHLAIRSDNMYILSWVQDLPGDIKFEQSRIMVTGEHVKKIIDILCKSANYYPKQPKIDK
ncbi:MAG: hypothetical protein WC677_08730 [Clostridia bacterium]|jgi:hypothetical protein